ncbi:hypothetical protein EYB53_014650 [Candidatus Chloroploca sp. M-50]|uniref:Uncharacterized protein n=1 Tax=Candidatus Chloroploca mongolica TaxID=2528176 RepID=A0ABS4DBY5_9CHLR|nr:hypothetical protein [Candidatus Chloroploca mongolica]MBP1466950.1 hypothetical protein [Candidatus Chloroploca mongolica]
MNALLLIIGSALLYPGALTALLAGVLYRMVRRGKPGVEGMAALQSQEGRANLAGLVLASLGLALLPWPLHPSGATASWLWAWIAFELAFLVPLVPALLTGRPALGRAAIREAQLGTFARALLWGALAVALTLHQRWDTIALLAHMLALLGALIAFPVAIGWGPFGPEEFITPGGVAAGLDADGQALDKLARDLRAGMLLAAVLVAVLPVGLVPAFISLPLIVGGIVIGALLLRNFDGRQARLTLPDALRFCLIWPLPLTLVATVVLSVVR